MSDQIIECVPNFSEGRRPEVLDAIQNTIASTPGVYVLDLHTDADHNRSVITFAGTPEGVEEAAFKMIGTAAELIDLTTQTGEHPRIGATDVVPFIPIQNTTMKDCIDLSHRLGERVAAELSIPVYLYEKAAIRKDRWRLEDIRQGQYDHLKNVIATDPFRAPDYGPKRLGPAGATVIGARDFLIAYNIMLNTPDVEIAKNIAKAIRRSSGGMTYLKALGLTVDGLAQVSMNFTNFRKTPLHRVTEMIRTEAAQYGVKIKNAELVGLIPQQALFDAASWYLQLHDLDLNQVLENRLKQAQQNN